MVCSRPRAESAGRVAVFLHENCGVGVRIGGMLSGVVVVVGVGVGRGKRPRSSSLQPRSLPSEAEGRRYEHEEERARGVFGGVSGDAGTGGSTACLESGVNNERPRPI